MQLFQKIKKFVVSVVQALSSLKNWLFGNNESIQPEREAREEAHFVPQISLPLVGLCAIGITSKTIHGLQATCRITNPFPKRDDESSPPGASFTWAAPTLPELIDPPTNTAACAA